MTRYFNLFLVAVFFVLLSIAQANWLSNRNVKYESDGEMVQVPRVSDLFKVKKYLPPRYQNLWGQGESSKVGNSAVASSLNVYKAPAQQKQVFAWQPQKIDTTVW
ncbi:unnamed protein product [Caenorhabditis angaria]|uniref:Uncharacterized protein n=1 Tax=Caenorhabditis angaria TaxID=860376 RepID=A0A9P1N564_9PELO|nr:unnamed protein product [Caenorhabditis angaria]